MLESEIERYLKISLIQKDGISFKWICPSFIGVPDRICFIKRQVWFVELKSKNGELSPVQKYVQKLILKYTDNVITLYTKEMIDEWVKTVCAA